MLGTGVYHTDLAPTTTIRDVSTLQTRRRVALNNSGAELFFSQAPIERENEARRPAAHGSAVNVADFRGRVTDLGAGSVG